MKTLIKNGQVFLAGKLTQQDILIKDDRIQAIGSHLEHLRSTDRVIDAKGKLVSPGLIDVHVHYREPGQTYKETVATGSQAAAHGGFTTVGAMPNVTPVPNTPELFQAMTAINHKDGVVHIKQYAPITVDRTTDELVDFKALKAAGAFGFSNDGNGVQTAGVMFQAMQAAAQVGLPIVAHVEDDSLKNNGVMNAGPQAEALGVPGIPSVCESSQLARDLMLAQATGVHYHVCHVSTKESVALIRWAKQQGINVTCEVTPHHLLLSDEQITKADPYYKMNPPLRSEADRQALIAGLLDGTIDMIATDHAPHSREGKQGDMQTAAFGITGSETAFATLYTAFVKEGIFTLEQLLTWMTSKPAEIFKLNDSGSLLPGTVADIAIFDLENEHVLTEEEYFSKGVNTPFTGMKVYGMTAMTLVAGNIAYSREEK